MITILKRSGPRQYAEVTDDSSRPGPLPYSPAVTNLAAGRSGHVAETDTWQPLGAVLRRIVAKLFNAQKKRSQGREP
jgi:hypothetical protein